MPVEVEGPLHGQSPRCMPVLRALPHWFGIEEANEAYARDIETLPTFVALDEGEVAGFLTLKQHFGRSAELLVMGVPPDRHRHGIGRALVERAEEWLRGRGVEYLQVKTQGPSREDEGYEKTRAFYHALDFVPLEEFPALWNPSNPALLLVKALRSP
jgi:GNAT superfamily N-acetyltransferase